MYWFKAYRRSFNAAMYSSDNAFYLRISYLVAPSKMTPSRIRRARLARRGRHRAGSPSTSGRPVSAPTHIARSVCTRIFKETNIATPLSASVGEQQEFAGPCRRKSNLSVLDSGSSNRREDFRSCFRFVLERRCFTAVHKMHGAPFDPCQCRTGTLLCRRATPMFSAGPVPQVARPRSWARPTTPELPPSWRRSFLFFPFCFRCCKDRKQMPNRYEL